MGENNALGEAYEKLHASCFCSLSDTTVLVCLGFVFTRKPEDLRLCSVSVFQGQDTQPVACPYGSVKPGFHALVSDGWVAPLSGSTTHP